MDWTINNTEDGWLVFFGKKAGVKANDLVLRKCCCRLDACNSLSNSSQTHPSNGNIGIFIKCLAIFHEMNHTEISVSVRGP